MDRYNNSNMFVQQTGVWKTIIANTNYEGHHVIMGKNKTSVNHYFLLVFHPSIFYRLSLPFAYKSKFIILLGITVLVSQAMKQILGHVFYCKYIHTYIICGIKKSQNYLL